MNSRTQLLRTLIVTLLAFGGVVSNARADLTVSTGSITAVPGVATTVSAAVTVVTPGVSASRVGILASAAPPATSDWVVVSGATGPATSPIDAAFSITITVPAGTKDGDYAFTLMGTLDGVAAGTASLDVHVGPTRSSAFRAPRLLRATWANGRLRARVTIGGVFVTAGHLVVVVNDGQAPTQRASFVVAAGSFARTLALRSDFPPGAIRIVQTFDSNMTGIRELVSTDDENLAPPRAGYVDHASMQARAGGAAASSFARGTRVLFASFHFANVPSAGEVATTWYEPDGSTTPSVAKPRSSVVTGFVRASTALAPGRWRCVIRVDGVQVGEVSARIR
jgi:hypothetical protein